MSRPRRSRQWWAKTVRAWSRSGLSAGEFAEEYDLSEHSLRWWKWKLGQESEFVEEEEATSALEFVEVEAPGAWVGPGLELVSPGGWTVRVPSGFEATDLARVVAVMEVER